MIGNAIILGKCFLFETTVSYLKNRCRRLAWKQERRTAAGRRGRAGGGVPLRQHPEEKGAKLKLFAAD